MPLQISQLELVVAIAKEIDRQHPGASGESYHYNAIIEGANGIVAAFAREPVRAKASMGLSAWLASDDTGSSSKAMAHHLMGVPFHGRDDRDRIAHPWDPADFGRCHRFLEAVPEAREKLTEMAKASPICPALIPAWGELTALFLEEFQTGNAPKTYARMKEIIDPFYKR